MTTKKQNISFEKATARLEQIIDKLDDPQTGLEEMISLAEEGLSLIRSGRQLLEQAELRIRMLENPDAGQEPVSTPQQPQAEEDGFSLQ